MPRVRNLKSLHKIRPLGRRILVERLPLQDKSEGGLYVLGREWPASAKILYASAECYKELRSINGAIPTLVNFDKWKWELRQLPWNRDQAILDLDDVFFVIDMEDD